MYLAPLHFPKHPLHMARFGLKALTSATHLAKRFHSKEARGLWAGMAAHSIQPLTNATTSAIGLVLMTRPRIQRMADTKRRFKIYCKCLASYFISLGGTYETNFYVRFVESACLLRMQYYLMLLQSNYCK